MIDRIEVVLQRVNVPEKIWKGEFGFYRPINKGLLCVFLLNIVLNKKVLDVFYSQNSQIEIVITFVFCMFLMMFSYNHESKINNLKNTKQLLLGYHLVTALIVTLLVYFCSCNMFLLLWLVSAVVFSFYNRHNLSKAFSKGYVVKDVKFVGKVHLDEKDKDKLEKINAKLEKLRLKNLPREKNQA